MMVVDERIGYSEMPLRSLSRAGPQRVDGRRSQPTTSPRWGRWTSEAATNQVVELERSWAAATKSLTGLET